MARPKIIYDFEANSVKLVSEIQKANTSLKGMHKGVEDMKSSLSLIKADSIINLGQRALQAGRQVYDFAKGIASAANDIERNARTLNMSTAEYQRWIYAAKMADVEAQDFINSFRFLTKAISEGQQGTGDASTAFRLLGINVKDASGKTKDQQTILLETIGALGKFADGANRDALMLAVFGRSFLTMKPLVNEGTEALKAYMTEAEKLGLVIKDGVLKYGGEAEKQFKQLEMQTMALKVSLSPLTLEVVKFFAAIADGIQKVTGMKEGEKDNYLWGQGWLSRAFGTSPEQNWSKGGWKGYGTEYGVKPKPEAPGIGMSDEAIQTIKEEREQYEKEYWDDQHQRWQIEDKDLDESSKAWGIYADEKIANLTRLNELDNAALKEEVDRREYANQRILEGQIEFNKDFTEAWDAANQMYVDKDKKAREESLNWNKMIGDSLESSITSNLTGMIKGAKSFKDVMQNIASSIADSFISAFVKIAMKWAMTKLDMESGSSGGGGINWGGLIGGVVKGIGGLFGGGGVSDVGVSGLTGTEMNSMTWLQEGGIVNKPMIAGVGDVPEAVIPLDRLETGQKEDRPPNITNINITTLDVSTMEQWVRKNSKLFVDVSVDNIRRGGQLSKAVRSA